jgi:glycosyltransferase involved in cell wall biosynthesis/ribosomal protein S18 acetylase RimI-like enzyme
MSRIIILTQYYPPETGAPQNRLHSLARFLRKKGMDVQVVTALPNYPKNDIFESYRGKRRSREVIDDVTVTRAWIFVNPSRGVVARLLNYFSFVITSFITLLSLRKADFILCESPPLFLGITGVLISKIKGSKLIFNVSDLWPESAEKLNIISNRSLLKTAYSLERWIYNNAYLISGQTKGIVRDIKSRFPHKNVVWVPNGVDFDLFTNDFPQKDWRQVLGLEEDDFLVVYAGIIGHAQGLEVILQAAELLREKPVHFLLVGDGPEKAKLQQLKQDNNISNVHFQPNTQKAFIPSLIDAGDAYVVPLKKLDLFKGAIPSKLFEPLAMRKPILLGVEGEAKELFIDEGQGGLFFEPENPSSLAEQVLTLLNNISIGEKLGHQGHDYVRRNFDRVQIHERFLASFKAEPGLVLTIKRASTTDLMAIAACHQKAFPKALSTAMGKTYLCKMLDWYLEDQRAFLFYLEQDGNCMGYCGGLKVDGAGFGSASSMIQHSFRQAIKAFLLRPWLFFHPEFLHKYKLAARNVISRGRKSFLKKPLPKPVQGKTSFTPHIGLIVIGVDPALQGMGYGSRLLKQFELASRQLGFSRLSLTVKTNNVTAIRSYTCNGWITTQVQGNSTTMEKNLIGSYITHENTI